MTAYALIRQFFRNVVVRVFFRQVDVVGAPRIPTSGPVIFVANHNNQFVDPIMLISIINRVVRFLIAAKSMHRPVVGGFARMLRAIGVVRAQDMAKAGTGTVSVEEGDVVAVGTGTTFQKDLAVGCKIKVAEVELMVKSVRSDTECIVHPSPVALSSAAFKVLPRVDQSAMYDQVHEALLNGDCIGIFPEGGSHDQASLIELKPGVAIMALGAMQAGAKGLKIVPCGLNYFEPFRFRSRVIVEFGEPFEVPTHLAEKYSTDKRGAVQELMTMVDDAMHGVMPGAKDWEELQAFLTMRALYKPRGKRVSPEETLKLNKMFALSRRRLTDDQKMSGLMEEVHAYVELLRAAGLRDRDVRLGLVRDTAAVWRTVSAAVQLVVLTPITVPTFLLSLPVSYLATTLALREKKSALANSIVKVKALDVVASYKIIVSIICLPLYNMFLAAVFTVLVHHGFLMFLLIYFLALPAGQYIGVLACDHSVRCYRRCKATLLFWGCAATAGIMQQFFVDRRGHLETRIREFVSEISPEMSADLAEDAQVQERRITMDLGELQAQGIIPSASANNLQQPLLQKDAAEEPSDGGGCAIM